MLANNYCILFPIYRNKNRPNHVGFLMCCNVNLFFSTVNGPKQKQTILLLSQFTCNRKNPLCTDLFYFILSYFTGFVFFTIYIPLCNLQSKSIGRGNLPMVI